MKKVNLRDLYPDVYKSDHFVEVTEDVLETLRAAERAEAAYDRITNPPLPWYTPVSPPIPIPAGNVLIRTV